MMTNLYPFLVGMAALAHERIDKFPDIDDPDNHALGVHCGYFGFVPRPFCTQWTLRPKVLEIVNDCAMMADCRMPEGKVTLAKIYPGFKKLSIIEAEIEKYVQYPRLGLPQRRADPLQGRPQGHGRFVLAPLADHRRRRAPAAAAGGQGLWLAGRGAVTAEAFFAV